MSEDPYRRRIRIKSSIGLVGHFVDVTDIDTGERVPHVVGVIIYLNPCKVNEAELTYLASNDQGKLLLRGEEPHAEPIELKMRVSDPEIDLLAYERLNAETISLEHMEKAWRERRNR